ncbi:molybdate ABC transporter substrate-binding protein [Aquimarina spongiae]|uniref:Molybdate transport system substrate-binding protein n=1 Tax=Aquimarina spongiae TaxID=570521 RepID=A0A1M6H1N4_9FLAO|nr:molybdate ABC transporter substrate-binding protein [Aquimarina spongiae]SHJ16066.1 molybdate transport system substrate-binding protein [Aquimarina spongiae]
MIKRVVLRVCILIFSAACVEQKSEDLRIAVSANMQFTIDDLVAAFKERTGIRCQVIIGSSGKLTAQIKEGAPYDIFVSADTSYPDQLFKEGYTMSAPKIYGYGKLVVWSRLDSTIPLIPLLTSQQVHHIAIANPKLAPYGKASVEVLKKMKVYDDIREKLVFGESILQTNQFVISGAAEVGFTSKSVVLSNKVKDIGSWVAVDQRDYKPIAQALVVIKHEGDQYKKAERFQEFFFTNTAKTILEKSGYTINSEE